VTAEPPGPDGVPAAANASTTSPSWRKLAMCSWRLRVPQAWAGQPQWLILETGFGLGLIS
jgi:hypothetical protein